MRTHIKETSKSILLALCEGNSLVAGEFSAQRASDADNLPFDDFIMFPVVFGGGGVTIIVIIFMPIDFLVLILLLYEVIVSLLTTIDCWRLVPSRHQCNKPIWEIVI